MTEAQNNSAVRDLLNSIGKEPGDEGTQLCSLLSIHLLLFADTDQAMLDAPVVKAWASLNPIQKWQLRRLAMRSFLRTKAVTRGGNDGEKHRKVAVHPYVALVMTARINPRFTLTLGNQGAARGIRVFAIDGGHSSADCYVMEKPDFSLTDRHKSISPLDWYYSYWLLARPFLATYLANYSAVPNEDDSPFAGQPRIISLYRPPVSDGNMVTRLEVHGAGSTTRVLRKGPGAPESAEASEMTVEELTEVISELLTTCGSDATPPAA